MNEQQKKDLVNQSVARLHQIKANLLQVDKQEEEALGKLPESAEATPDQRLAVLAVETRFLRARAELYNERATVACHLLNFGDLTPAVEDAEIKALARDVSLASKLNVKRQQAGSKENMGNKAMCAPCTDCTTACTACVTSCTSCITTYCLISA